MLQIVYHTGCQVDEAFPWLHPAILDAVTQFPRPQPCALLRPGAQFAGYQTVSRVGSPSKDWAVVVEVEQCDWDRGYVCGTMTASLPPPPPSPLTPLPC